MLKDCKLLFGGLALLGTSLFLEACSLEASITSVAPIQHGTLMEFAVASQQKVFTTENNYEVSTSLGDVTNGKLMESTISGYSVYSHVQGVILETKTVQ